MTISTLLFSYGAMSQINCEHLPGSWKTRAPMPTARLAPTAQVVDGKVYAIGGYAEANAPGLRSLEVYHPDTDSWHTLPDMPTGRRQLTSAVVDDIIYVIGGGSAQNSPVDALEAYDPEDSSWTILTPMPTARFGAVACELDGKIYVLGGADGVSNLPTMEVYDPDLDEWSSLDDMPGARAFFGMAAVQGKIYIIGGPGPGAAHGVVLEYDPVKDANDQFPWARKAEMPTARFALTTAILDDKIYAIGGHDASVPLENVEVYDPVTDCWDTLVANTPSTKFLAASVSLNGRIYVLGGALSHVPPHPGVTTLDEYTPEVSTGLIYHIQSLPEEIMVRSSFPNPFYTNTEIVFEPKRPAGVEMKFITISGQEVHSHREDFLDRGIHSVIWQGSDQNGGKLPSGVYQCLLETHPLGAEKPNVATWGVVIQR